MRPLRSEEAHSLSQLQVDDTESDERRQYGNGRQHDAEQPADSGTKRIVRAPVFECAPKSKDRYNH